MQFNRKNETNSVYIAEFICDNLITRMLICVGKKITKLLALKEDMDFEIYWDGACSADKILEYAPKGVTGFVLGTTLLFGKDKPYAETLRDIRELCF